MISFILFLYSQNNMYFFNNLRNLKAKHLSIVELWINDLLNTLFIITIHKCLLTFGWWPNILLEIESKYICHLLLCEALSLSTAFVLSGIWINFTTPGKAQSLFSTPLSSCRKNAVFQHSISCPLFAALSIQFSWELSFRGPHFLSKITLLDLQWVLLPSIGQERRLGVP